MFAAAAASNAEKKHGRFYEWSERTFNNTIAFYGRTVKFVLKHQTITLLIPIGTLIATIYLYIVVPKGFFPVQDTGVIMGISDAPESISFAAMSERQQSSRGGDPEGQGRREPVVVHRSRRHEHHPNSGRIADQSQIARRPLATTSPPIMKRLQQEVAGVEGITLYMQPVQDLTVEDRVSRTQYQFTSGRCRCQRAATRRHRRWWTS